MKSKEHKLDYDRFKKSTFRELDYTNIVSQYIIALEDVKDVGDLTAVVKISQKPIFSNNKSIDVIFLSDLMKKGEPTQPNTYLSLGQTTISYKSIGAEDYRKRIELSLIFLRRNILTHNIYGFAREAAMKFLPRVILDHETKYTNQ
jgi:hypothetical protein